MDTNKHVENSETLQAVWDAAVALTNLEPQIVDMAIDATRAPNANHEQHRIAAQALDTLFRVVRRHYHAIHDE